MAADVALPEGFVLDQGEAALPPGFVLDSKPSRLATTGFNVARGLLTGGPIGAAVAGMGEGMRGLDEAADTAGGAATDALAGHVPPELAGAAGALLKTGIPAAVGAVGGSTGTKGMDFLAKRTMQSALKPSSKSIANGDAAKAIQTMLDDGVAATPGGAVKLRFMIGKVKAELADLLSKSEGTLVGKNHVYKELSKTLDDVAKQGNPDAATNAVRESWAQFVHHPLIKDSDKIPVQLAQDIKRGTQRAVKDSYGRLTTTPDSERAQMAIASGLRQGIEEALPATAGYNAKLSQYINALHQIEPKAAIAANKDLGGLVPLAPTPEAALLMAADRNPWIKSYVARVLHSGRRTIPVGAGAATGSIATQGQE